MAEQGEFELDGGEVVEPEPAVEGGEPTEPVEPVQEPDPTPDPLQAQLDEERERRIRLEERLAAQQAEPPPPKEEPPQRFTRAELRKAVEEGQIDNDQLEEIWAKQQREVHKRDTEEILTRREQQRSSEDTIESETQKYHETFPDITDTKSENWKKVKREYDFLVKIGNPDSKATELMALRSALGSPTQVQERTSRLRETPQDTSGGVNDPGGRGTRPVDIFNRIPPKYRSYYKGRYDDGQITLEDIEKDLPYMDKTA